MSDAEADPGDDDLHLADALDAWPALSFDERVEMFRLLPRDEAEDLFFGMTALEQCALIRALPPSEHRSWARVLAPDDAADLIQAAKAEEREKLLSHLDDMTRADVRALLAYAEDEAGGLMNPRFAKLRGEMTAEAALTYLRKQSRANVETLTYIYVVDEAQRLVGVVSLRDLFTSSPGQRVADMMHTDVVSVPEHMDREVVSRLVKQQELLAVPVIDVDGRIKGIVTVDDIVDVVEEEATEDIQKIGGMVALEAPYLTTGFWTMVKKRGGWLAVLFLGELLTASAMGFFEDEIQKAVALATFIPLIISSGGNSGSQASTLVIRALALGEIGMRDWWRIARRELASGLVLGSALGAMGLSRVLVWQAAAGIYGEHYLLVGLTIGVSLLGVVLLGTLAGSMLPLILRRVGLDPASASAPLVATLVDVTGLVIYFSVAVALLGSTLLR